MAGYATLTYDGVCKELDRRRKITLGFERIEALLEALGHPERHLRCVQVVGTNGKGTTAVSLAALLEAAGHSAGAYLSPHVLSYTERVILRGRESSEQEFASAMSAAIGEADANNIPASQFELLTAGALKAFADAGLEWAVLEAGLGARHDATSTVEAEMVVLTNVGLDHTGYLGETVSEIAGEKLASLRPGASLVLGTADPAVLELARRRCEEAGATLAATAGEEEVEKIARLPGYMAHDLCVAARAAELLLGRGLSGGERRACAGALRLPARFERFQIHGVPVIVDGGHNEEALRALLQAVREEYGASKIGAVFGVLKDKNIGSMLSLLSKEAYTLVLTRPVEPTGRAADPDRLLDKFGPDDAGGRVRVIYDVNEAVDALIEEMRGAGGVVLVTGSLYTGAAVLRRLRES